MADAYHFYGEDLQPSSTGSLALVTGGDVGFQRVLRRLLTSPGADCFNPTYGAGLALYIGKPVDPMGIKATILAQMKMEAAVAQNPPPQVTVTATTGGAVTANVVYADAVTRRTVGGIITVPAYGAITAQLASSVSALN